VGPASQQPMVITEKLVWPPIERCSGVDTIVDISVVATSEVHKKPFNEPLAPKNVKLRAAPGPYLVQRCGPHTRVSQCTVSNSNRFHSQNLTRLRATPVNFGARERPSHGRNLWPFRKPRPTNTAKALTLRRIAGGYHCNFPDAR
jgi:hypothetical protein